MMLKELHRLRMIINGVAVATSLHPPTPLIIIINGAIRGKCHFKAVFVLILAI